MAILFVYLSTKVKEMERRTDLNCLCDVNKFSSHKKLQLYFRVMIFFFALFCLFGVADIFQPLPINLMLRGI